MKKSRLLGAVCATVFCFFALPSHSALIGRIPVTPGGTDYQAAYDDVLDITWVTNASLSGYNRWWGHVEWASNLDYLGFDDWRLASMSVTAPQGSLTDVTISSSVFNCSSATEQDCQNNELSYMYYHNLASISGADKTGTHTIGDVTLTDVFTDYWSSTEFDSVNAWFFSFRYGDQLYQTIFDKGYGSYGWAVRDGDVGTVPVPAAVWLFGTGLLGLIGIAGKKTV